MCQPRGRTSERRHLVVQLVDLVALLEPDRPVDRVGEVALPVDHVLPRRRVRVLEVGHEDLRAAVQGVDHHLAIGRPGDLDAAVGQIRRRRRHAPVALAHASGSPRGSPAARRRAAAAHARARAASISSRPPPSSRCSRCRNSIASGVRTSSVLIGGPPGERCSGDSPRMDASTSSIGWNAGVGRPARRSAAVTCTRQPGLPLAYASGSAARTFRALRSPSSAPSPVARCCRCRRCRSRCPARPARGARGPGIASSIERGSAATRCAWRRWHESWNATRIGSGCRSARGVPSSSETSTTFATP